MSARLKEFIRIQRERARRVYHRARNVWPVWFYVLNWQARRAYARARPALTWRERAIVTAIDSSGIAVVPMSELFGPETFAELSRFVHARWLDPAVQAEAAAHRSQPRDRGDKYYNVDLWERPRFIRLSDPLIRWSLDERILRIVAGYLRMYPKFRAVSLWASLPVPPGAPEHASQLWHRDPEDKKTLKVFLYLSDVDAGAGPFTYVRASHHGGRWRRLFPQMPPVGFYPPHGAVDRIVPPEDITAVTGPAGTMIFCDTSGLHKGGYCRERTRFMYQAVFASPAGLEPLNYRYPPDFDPSGLTPMAGFALENREP